MKILSTLGIVVLYFLVAVGVVSTIEYAFTLMNKPDTLAFVGGLGLLIVTLFFIVAIVMQIINEYKQSNLYKTWQKKATGKSSKKKENKKN
jgi:hypothetical protein